MYAVEFNTETKDGTIKIPEIYKNLKNKSVKVIILTQENELQENETHSSLDTFLSDTIKIDNFIMPSRKKRNER